MEIRKRIQKFFSKPPRDAFKTKISEPRVYAKKSLFQHFTATQLKVLHGFFEKLEVAAETEIIKESATDQGLYIIEKGSVEAFKISSHSHQQHRLKIMHKGECFGELSLLRQRHRSASVRTLEETKLLVLSGKAFTELKHSHPDIYNLLLENLAAEVAERLRVTNETTIQALEDKLVQSKERGAAAILMAYTVFLSSIYILLASALHYLIGHTLITAFVTVPLVLIIAAIAILAMKHSKIPMQEYGFSLKNWPAVLLQSFLWTIPFIGFITFLKYVVVHAIPALHNIPVIQISLNWTIVLYLISAALQEVIFRGGIQSPLMYFLPASRYRNLIIVGITSTIFAAIHGHLSFWYTLVAFIPSIFWSILYLRQKSLLGVYFSHFLIGIWAIQIMSIQTLLIK